MIADRTRLVPRFTGSALAVVLLLTIVNDPMRYVLAWSATNRIVHISVALSNPVEQTVYGAPLQASEWQWPVRYWWHTDAAPAIRYEWNSRVVLRSDVQ